ncbi:MAG: two-component system, response regulator PdtaR [Clostridia bacterium]|jgi:response regulator NasT|nr:two-component system, response regulator PdtaR [Clostridia bacterium]
MKVILAEDDPIIRMDLKYMLKDDGIDLIGECSDGLTAIHLTKMHRPDIVLMDIRMPKLDGIKASRIIYEKMLASVVLLTAYSDEETIKQALNSGAQAYLVKPIEKKQILPAFMLAVARFEAQKTLINEVKSLNQIIADRKIINQAKKLLQNEYKYTEQKAFQIIRDMSKQKNKNMRDIAQEILKNSNFS